MTLPPPVAEPSIVDFLLWSRTALAHLCESRADPRATWAEVSDDVYSLTAILSHIRSHVQSLMPQTVFRNGFWARLVELSRTEEAVAVFDRLATRDGVAQRLVVGEFFGAIVEACRLIQEERGDLGGAGKEGGFLDRLWDLATHSFRPTVERMPVTVRGERIAWIVYNLRVRRVVATGVELAVG